MIKVYNPEEKLFATNGLKILHPLLTEIHKADNGDYYVELQDTIENLNYYQKGMIIRIPTPWGDQGFRCDNPKIRNNKIECKAWHLSYDSKNYIIQDAYAVDKNCNDALEHFNSNTDMTSPFTTTSDITTILSTRGVRKSLYEIYEWLVSSDKYGGHWYRDNWTLGIKSSIGQDRGVVLAYNKNIDDIEVSENWDNVCTKMLPYTTDGEVAITLDTPYVSTYKTGTPVTMTKNTNSGKNIFDINLHDLDASYTNSNGILSTTFGRTDGGKRIWSGSGVPPTEKCMLLSSGTYTISADISSGTLGARPSIYVVSSNDASTIGNVFGISTTTEYQRISKTFTISSDTYVSFAFQVDTTGTQNTKNIQLELGSTPTTYEPYDAHAQQYYLDGVSTQETRSGKNLFNLTGVSNTTIGSLLDGIVTLNWSGGYDCFILNNSSQYTALDSTKTYTLSFKHKGNKIYLKDYNNSSNYVLTNNDSDYVSYSFTFTSVSSMRLDANRSDTTGTAYIKDFQLEVGSAKTDYEEYGAMPSPDYPSEIVNIYQAGTYQTAIDNKVYTFTLTDDLRSAGSIADRLWLDTTNLTFEVVKNVGTKTLDGSESYSLYSSNSVRTILSTNISDIASYTSSSSIPMLMSNYYKPASQSATWKCGDISRITGVALIYLVQTNGYTVASFQTWLGTHNTLVHYALATSTSTSGIAEAFDKNLYDFPYTKVVKFDNELNKDDYETEEAFILETKTWLLGKANTYLQEHQVPLVNYSLSASIQDISDVGDTIYVKHPKCNVNITTQVISIVYDANKKKYTKIEFGNFKKEIKNLTQQITAEVDKTTTKAVEESKVLLQNELQQATATINNMLGNSYKVIEEDKIMFVDRLPKEEATYVLKISNGGIGFSSTGINGTFTSAWTLDGTLNMGAINVINLTASLIKGGTLKLGGVNNSSGTFELYDNSNNLIMLQDRTGITVYATNGDYVKLNAIDGFAGFDKNNNKVYFADGDTFHMKNAEVENQIKIAGKIKIVPVNSLGHVGVGFVAIPS